MRPRERRRLLLQAVAFGVAWTVGGFVLSLLPGGLSFVWWAGILAAIFYFLAGLVVWPAIRRRRRGF